MEAKNKSTEDLTNHGAESIINSAPRQPTRSHLMSLRSKINPDNDTEMWFTLDGREPTLEDHDFGADFYYVEESEAVEGVRLIQERLNATT